MNCNCDEWTQTVKFETVTSTSDSPVFIFDTLEDVEEIVQELNDGKVELKTTPVISIQHWPVLVCVGCDKESNAEENGKISYEKYLSNFVRNDNQFENDLEILLLDLGHYMNKADKSLEWFRNKEESE